MNKQNVFIFAILVTSTLSSGLVFADSKDQPTKDVEPVALVRTQFPVKKSLMDTITVYGSIQNPPQAIYNVNLPQAGQITAIYVSTGQYVRKGQALLTIKTDPQLIMNT
uniref:biotin/lipoyl-binding protein n=1 Tax=Acinetobacter sp. 161(2023) TaxID=3098768 RepID=UPI003008B411